MFIDSHAHFDMIDEEGSVAEEELLCSMRENKVLSAVQVSIDLPSLEWSRKFISRNSGCGFYFTAGIHPSSRADDEVLGLFRSAVDDIIQTGEGRFLLGIGECGLDYYRMRQPEEVQRRSFEFQINCARTLGLPIIVHTRDATDDTLDILKHGGLKSGIIHCFPGDRTAARRFLDLGFYLSFAGNITYNKAAGIQDAGSYVPLDRILIETDAPFLTPVPMRGKKNRPDYIEHTYRFIANLRKESLTSLQESVHKNFLALIGNNIDKEWNTGIQ